MAKQKMTADQKTLQMIELVKQKKVEISKLDRPNYKTNMSFSITGGRMSDAKNLNTVSDVQELISYASIVVAAHQHYYDGAAQLQISYPPKFTWQGYELQDWLDDIKIRIDKTKIAEKRKELETLEARLNSIISPELRKEMELEDIEKALGLK